MVSKRRTFRRVAQSVLYHASFWFLVLLAGVTLGGSAWGLISQAWRTRGQRRINVLILVGGYAVLATVAILIALVRFLGNIASLREIPHGYIPTKEEDLPKPLAQYITSEYTRTTIIAHLQQHTAGTQPGWGSPHGPFAHVHFRTFILDSLGIFRSLLPPDHSIPEDYKSPSVVGREPLFRHPIWKKLSPEDQKFTLENLERYRLLLDDAKFGVVEMDEEDFTSVVVLVIGPLTEMLKSLTRPTIPTLTHPAPVASERSERSERSNNDPSGSPLRQRASSSYMGRNPFGSETTARSEGSSRVGLISKEGLRGWNRGSEEN